MNVLITPIKIFIFSLYLFLIRPIGLNVESWNRPLDSIAVTKRYSSIHTSRPTVLESYPIFSKESLTMIPSKSLNAFCVSTGV